MFSHLQSLFSDIPLLLLRIPVILIALTVHEVMHAKAAFRHGDPTARNLGRTSLNPLKHLDPIGTILLFVAGFGWAKPVPVNSRYLEKPRRDMALIAIAGPLSNLCMGLCGILFYAILSKIYVVTGLIVQLEGGLYLAVETEFAANLIRYSLLFVELFYSINISLAVFNLLPIPPLDGSRLATLILPPKWYYTVMRYEQYIYLGLMALVIFTDVLTFPLSWLVGVITNGAFWLINLIPFLSI